MADKKVEAKKGSGKKSWFSRVKQYWKDTAAELKKVVWPTKEQTRNNTAGNLPRLLGRTHPRSAAGL